MLKKYAALALGVLYLLAAGQARAVIGDYAVRPDVGPGDSVTAMDFTPDGRFLVILSGKPGTVSFFDTWDMAPLMGGTAQVAVASGATVALSLSVSPVAELPFAYVGLSTGEVVIVNLTKVVNLGALEELTALLPIITFSMAANPITHIMAVPEVAGNTANVYLLAGIPASNRLAWTRLAGGSQLPTVYDMTLNREPVALSRGKYYGYALDRRSDGQHLLDIISCSDLNKQCGPLSELAIVHASGALFSGLASDRLNDNYSVTFNQDTSQEFLIDNFDTGLPQVVLADAFTVSDATVSLAMQGTPFDSTLGDVILGAGGNTVTITEVSSSSLAFGGSYGELNLGIPLTTMAASGGTEGYAFVGSPDGGVWPVTANPWVTSLTTATSGETVTLTFSADTETTGTMKFEVLKNVGFRDWPASITGNSLLANVVTTATVKFWELSECENAVTLIVQDALGRQGRAVTGVVKDSAPSAPNFSLGFGSKKIIVDFTVSDLCDLDRYAIFWGDTNSLPTTDYELLASYGDSIAIESPVAGDRIQKTISGLTDGKRYYVQLVVFDATGNVGVSQRLSVVPQAVNTLTGAAGEDGGFNCLGSVGDTRRGDPRALIGLLLPLLIYGVARVSRRETR